MAGVINQYLDTLRSELAFDPRLAERVCCEVREHLLDIAEQEAGDPQAELHAVKRMGDPRLLAAGMARAAMPTRVKLTWRTVALSALAVFLAMRLRNVLIPVDNLDLQTAALALAVDRIAFGTAVLAGLVGWLITKPDAQWFRNVRTVTPAYVCATALALSSAAGCYLLGCALLSVGWTAEITTPALAVSAEIVVLALAFRALRDLARQVRSASA